MTTYETKIRGARKRLREALTLTQEGNPSGEPDPAATDAINAALTLLDGILAKLPKAAA
jgi:hypothetical protein